uniref:TYR_PHOSPHATASE_2 domain-containing protein n=1 Tax=Steinernema glaseri TaxID=37863 RepID=A0A1I8A2P7_9BILA
MVCVLRAATISCSGMVISSSLYPIPMDWNAIREQERSEAEQERQGERNRDQPRRHPYDRRDHGARGNHHGGFYPHQRGGLLIQPVVIHPVWNNPLANNMNGAALHFHGYGYIPPPGPEHDWRERNQRYQPHFDNTYHARNLHPAALHGNRPHRDQMFATRGIHTGGHSNHREGQPRRERNGRNRGGRQGNALGALPDRWKSYVGVGAEVSHTSFIPFKTPLRPEFNNRLREDEIFNVETLLTCARNKDKRIGLVIDLTNTGRYYDSNLWANHGILYKKIPNSGQGVHTQGSDLFRRFRKAVEDFQRDNRDSADLLIGVHCTHGLNRTGYLICRYMIEVLNIDAKTAISEFEKARGHMIRRGEYVNALKEIAQTRPDFSEVDWEQMMNESSRRAAVMTGKKTSWLETLRGNRQPVEAAEGAEEAAEGAEEAAEGGEEAADDSNDVAGDSNEVADDTTEEE